MNILCQDNFYFKKIILSRTKTTKRPPPRPLGYPKRIISPSHYYPPSPSQTQRNTIHDDYCKLIIVSSVSIPRISVQMYSNTSAVSIA